MARIAPADSERLRKIAALLREAAAELEAIAEPRPVRSAREVIVPTDLERAAAARELRQHGALPRRR